MNAFRRAFKNKLKTAGIARHWHDTAYPGERYDSGQKDYFQDMAERHHDGAWKRVDLPVEHTEGHHEGHDASEDYIKEYAEKRRAGSAYPPIIAKPHPTMPGKWQTVDGQHRLKAAKLTGDKTISAYVPVKISKAEQDLIQLLKSPYGPQGMGLYSQNDNARRKMSRTTEVAQIGPNSAVQTTKVSSKQQAAALAQQARQKSKQNPVKIFTRAEINKLMRSGFKAPKVK